MSCRLQFCYLGIVTSLEVNHKNVDKATKGQEVCIKIENVPGETPKLFGRHFDENDVLVSKVCGSCAWLQLRGYMWLNVVMRGCTWLCVAARGYTWLQVRGCEVCGREHVCFSERCRACVCVP